MVTISKKNKSVQLHFPEGVTGRIPLSQLKMLKTTAIVVDGKSFNTSEATTDILLSAGNHVITMQ